jgi:RNA polymerase sigma-70 factor, ECF subfamily
MAREQTNPRLLELPGQVGSVADAGDAPIELAQFFERYAPYVARIGHRLLGRDDEVDDLIQDVFLAAHRGIRRLREVEAVKGWLATVAVRQCRRRLRARRARSFLHLDASPEYMNLADERASPEQRALLANVYRLLDRLPANQRIAWTLRYVEGEQLERIAQMCGCSLATAKRRIRAAQQAIEQEVASG